jgi:hypothetical protein
METDSTPTTETPPVTETPAEPPHDEAAPEVAAPAPAETPPVQHQDLAEWRGNVVLDRNGARVGPLQDVYFDVESDEPQFGTVKEGWLVQRLTFVPLAGVTIGPSSLQVTATKEQIKASRKIARAGQDLSAEDESALYHHYQLNYTPTEKQSGRRLARR